MSPGIRAAARGRRWLPYLALAAAAAVVYLPELGRRELWNPDEPRYAEVAREMEESGDYLVPHLNGEVYSHKPPLFFWAVAAAGALRGGVDETAARLPSALAAIGTILLVFALADRLFGRRAAWLAALVLGTCFKVLWQGRFGQIDMLLTFLVTLAMLFWVRGLLERRVLFYRLFFVATGLAILAKGPVGLLPPLLAIVGFLWWEGERDELRRLRPFTGTLISLAVVAVWLVPAGLGGGGEYLEDILVRQNLTRFAAPADFTPTSGHHHPFWYYPYVIAVQLFPWTLFLPAAAVAARRAGRPEDRRGLHIALWWLFVTLVFFSLSPAKRDVYVLTLYPALALLVGAGLARWGEARASRAWLAGAAAGVALVWTAIALASELIPIEGTDFRALGSGFADRVAWVAVPALAGALWGAVESWWRRPGRAAVAVGAGMALTFLAAVTFVLPPLDAFKTARPLSEALLTRLGPEDDYAMYPQLEPRFLFYVRRPALEIVGEEELRGYVARAPHPLVLAPRDALAPLDPPLPLVELAAEPERRDSWVLLGPPDEGP